MTLNMTKPIIGFTGKAGAGKDTVANFATVLLHEMGINSVKIACADRLKDLCAVLFGETYGIPNTAFYGTQAEKEAPLEAVPGWSGRRILQFVGTECFRHIEPNMWATNTIATAMRILSDPSYKAVFISDVRFLSEERAIRNAGGIIVRVKNPDADAKESNHASETELLQIKEDFVIDNQGRELYLLENLVKDFLCKLNF